MAIDIDCTEFCRSRENEHIRFPAVIVSCLTRLPVKHIPEKPALSASTTATPRPIDLACAAVHHLAMPHSELIARGAVFAR